MVVEEAASCERKAREPLYKGLAEDTLVSVHLLVAFVARVLFALE